MNRKIRYWIIEAAVVSVVLVMLFIYMFPKFLEAQNINTPEKFPDPLFRFCAEIFMGVQPGESFSQIEAEKRTGSFVIDGSVSIHLSKVPEKVKSLEGLHFFKSIYKLSISGVSVDSIDLSPFTNLIELQIEYSNLTTLDLCHTPKLRRLVLIGVPVNSLDLRQNTKLSYIMLLSVNLISLQLPKSSDLEEIVCRSSRLASLDVSNNPDLERLDLSSNQFEDLPDLSHNPKLNTLVLENNRFDCADLQALKELAKRFPHNTYSPYKFLTNGFEYLKQKGMDLSDCGQ